MKRARLHQTLDGTEKESETILKPNGEKSARSNLELLSSFSKPEMFGLQNAHNDLRYPGWVLVESHTLT